MAEVNMRVPTIWVGDRPYMDQLTLEVLLRDFAKKLREEAEPGDRAADIVDLIVDAIQNGTVTKRNVHG